MNSVRLVLSIATSAILAATVGAAQARKEVTQEQYMMILACMKSGHSNDYCVRAVTGSR